RDPCQGVFERLGLGRGAGMLGVRLGAPGVGLDLCARTTAIERRVLVARATHARVEVDELVLVEERERGGLGLAQERLLSLVQHGPGRLLHAVMVPWGGSACRPRSPRRRRRRSRGALWARDDDDRALRAVADLVRHAAQDPLDGTAVAVGAEH